MNAPSVHQVWPAEGRLFAISGFDVRVMDGPHPLQAMRQAEIEANWRAEQAANPALFNGEMLMHRDIRIGKDGLLTANAHLTSYATMLWWRKQHDRPVAEHLFPIAVPITRDGAILAIEMGAHTANGGRVYCAAGSLDVHDIVGGRVDFAGNMQREVAEEIGMDIASMTPLSDYFGLRVNRAVTVVRAFQLPYDAEEASARVRAHMAVDHEKEIAGPVIIRNAETTTNNYPAFMPPIIEWIFGSESPIRIPHAKG
jgi:8-oxo-dGTP pyrophosphatase MutT (NUDIX family)